MVADGLALSCANHKGQYIAPSLSKFYDALEEEFQEGLCLGCIRDGDLSPLANQGILLWNAGLTIRVGEAGCYNELWEPFQEFFFKEIISLLGVPVMLLGNDAHVFASQLPPWSDTFLLEHPAYACRQQRPWKTNGTFAKFTQIIKDKNSFDIKWAQELPF